MRLSVVFVNFWLAYLDLYEFEIKFFAGVVLNRCELFEGLLDAMLQYPLKRIHLRGYEVRSLNTRRTEPAKKLLFTHRGFMLGTLVMGLHKLN